MASHTKPVNLTYLKPGKAVGAHPGFAGTFNWLVDCQVNRRLGEGLFVEYSPDSAHPFFYGNKITAGENVTVDDDGEGSVTISAQGGSETLTFQSASDSNVQISKVDGVVTIGVYWL